MKRFAALLLLLFSLSAWASCATTSPETKARWLEGAKCFGVCAAKCAQSCAMQCVPAPAPSNR